MRAAQYKFISSFIFALYLFSLSPSFAQQLPDVINFKIIHTPITSSVPNEKIKLTADIIDSRNVSYVAIKYRLQGEERYQTLFMKKSKGDKFVTYMPASRIVPPGLEYYIFVMDTAGVSHVLFRDKNNPQIISVRTLEDAAFDTVGDSPFGEAFGLGLQEEFALFAAEDVVITAAKREQKIEQAPSAITVISAEDIAASGAQSITDLLRIVPGFDVWTLSNSYEIIGCRGRTDESGNLVLVLVDGREQNIGFFGIPMLQQMPINLADIKRIEVIRGPGSSLYGANAFSAIVNIITKKPDEAKGYYFDYMGGGIRTHQMQAYAAGTNDDLGFLVSGGVREAARFSDRLADELSQRVVRTVVTYEINEDMSIRADAGSGVGSVEPYSTIGEFLADGQMQYAQINYNWGGLTFRFDWTNIDIDLLPKDPIVSELIPAIEAYGNTYNSELQYVWAPIDWSTLTVGGNYKLSSFFSEVLNPHLSEENMAGFYVQEEIKPVDWITLIAGGRYDYNSLSDAAISPRLAMVVTIAEGQTLRFNGAKAFRKPAFYESQLQVSGLKEIGITISNPELENEELITVEAGYAARLGDRVRLNLDTFYNMYRNTIEWLVKESTFSNQGHDIDAYGFEAGTRLILAEWFDTQLNYSYLHEEITETGETLLLRPRHKANAGLHFHFDFGLLFTVLAHYVGPYNVKIVDPVQGNLLMPYYKMVELGDYTVLNLKLGMRFWQDRLELGVSVFNALYGKDNAVHQFPGIDYFDSDGPDGPVEPENFGGEPLYRRAMGYAVIRF
jgi:iron complex outermembrane recepter protein